MRFHKALVLLLLTVGWAAYSVHANDVDTLLKHERPAGVVFEIIQSDAALLGKTLPGIRRDIERLRKQFPDLPVAIVSHGREQFALTSDNAERYEQAHSLVQQLTTNDAIDVHVCAAHASWYQVTPEDFPDYVDVSPSAPAQINDYEKLGFEVIVIAGE